MSHYIEWQEALAFLSAIERFQREKVEVNTLVTVNLEWLGIPAVNCSEYTRQSFQRLKRQMVKTGCPWAMVWVLENSPPVGVHLHFLIHRSSELMMDYHLFGKQLRKAFKVNKKWAKAKTIKFGKFNTWRASYEHNRGHLEKYLLKGIRPEVARDLGIVTKKQGTIIGKRIGWMASMASN